jgi:hypothetical protein
MFRRSGGQDTLVLWNREVQNPDKKEEAPSRGQLSVYRCIEDRHFVSPRDGVSETFGIAKL